MEKEKVYRTKGKRVRKALFKTILIRLMSFPKPVPIVLPKDHVGLLSCADHQHALPYRDAITRHFPAFDA